MAEDAARIAQLEAEVTALREREAALTHEVERLRPALAESQEQQTVTAEVLRVIAASPNDLDRVLTSVAESAACLCEINDRHEADPAAPCPSRMTVSPSSTIRLISSGEPLSVGSIAATSLRDDHADVSSLELATLQT